jgi:hypothetical protein
MPSDARNIALKAAGIGWGAVESCMRTPPRVTHDPP